MKNEKPAAAQPHAGISMHRIRVGGDSMGLIAAVGAILVCVLGIRGAGWFLALSLLVGLLAALAFRIWFRRRPTDVEPLSLKDQSALSQQTAKSSAADDTDALKLTNGNQLRHCYQL